MADHFRIISASKSPTVARSIAKAIRIGHSVVLRAIGPISVNQAVKAIAIARHYLVDDHLDVVFVPEIAELALDGSERNTIHFYLDRPGREFPSPTDALEVT